MDPIQELSNCLDQLQSLSGKASNLSQWTPDLENRVFSLKALLDSFEVELLNAFDEEKDQPDA